MRATPSIRCTLRSVTDYGLVWAVRFATRSTTNPAMTATAVELWRRGD